MENSTADNLSTSEYKIEIEPIFTDENWEHFLDDLKKIVKRYYCIKNIHQGHIMAGMYNTYGNKIEIEMLLQKSSPEITAGMFMAYISILESVLSKQPLKNHIFTFSVKFEDLIPEKNNDDIPYKENKWIEILNMHSCLLKIHTVLKHHYFQAPLLQVISFELDKDWNYPIRFTCKIMNEDMANSYKFVKKNT